MLETPVLLIIFNRPDLTRQAIDALAQARPSRLFIAADGPRHGVVGERSLCLEARQIADSIDWPCEVHKRYSDSNQGCKVAVRSAITWFFETVEEGIILEDDCIPSPSFFRFCAEMLAHFRDDRRIMAVCGSYYGDDGRVGGDDVTFSYFPDIWGWATWRRAWQLYDRDMSRWNEFKAREGLKALCGDRPEALRYWNSSFVSTHAGNIDTWDYQWIFSVMAQGGLACYPTRNLILNAGLRPDATHTVSAESFPKLLGRSRRDIDFPLRLPTMIMRSPLDDVAIETRRLAIPPSDVVDASSTRLVRSSPETGKILRVLLDGSLADQAALRDVLHHTEANPANDENSLQSLGATLAGATLRWRASFDPSYVDLAYRFLLGRPAAEQETSDWMSHIGVNLTFSNFLDAVHGSAEAQAYRDGQGGVSSSLGSSSHTASASAEPHDVAISPRIRLPNHGPAPIDIGCVDHLVHVDGAWCAEALSAQGQAFVELQSFSRWAENHADDTRVEAGMATPLVAERDVSQATQDPRFVDVASTMMVVADVASSSAWKISRTMFDAGFIGCAFHDDGGVRYRLYLRSSLFQRPADAVTPSRGRVSMSSLGNNGRFANQLHQYAFILFYALRHELTISVPHWRGCEIFELSPAGSIEPKLPTLAFAPFQDDDIALWDLEESLIDVDLWGYFQEIPRCWLPHRAFLTKIFSLPQTYRQSFDAWLSVLTENGRRRLIACHVRRGDYEDLGSDATPWFRPIPLSFYEAWLGTMDDLYPTSTVYIATDDPARVLPAFAGRPIVTVALAPDDIGLPDDIIDFAVLQRAQELAVANSSYSRMAALTSQANGASYIPNVAASRFEPYRPWDDTAFWERFGTRSTDVSGHAGTTSSLRRRILDLRIEAANLKAEVLESGGWRTPVPESHDRRAEISYPEVFARYGCPARGVIHIGGFVGAEDEIYRKMGFENRVFIEAQPSTFAKLEKNLQNSGASLENVAVSDRNGVAVFHEADNGQSSSILALKRHSDIYPEIREVASYEIWTRRLDDIMSDEKYVDLEFNFLNIDIQGAELLALSGGIQTLKRMDIINIEVNFDELYEGAPHIVQLDSFLETFGFIRADTFLWHASWGDAVYVRRSLARA